MGDNGMSRHQLQYFFEHTFWDGALQSMNGVQFILLLLTTALILFLVKTLFLIVMNNYD